jgi:hypothetical protein
LGTGLAPRELQSEYGAREPLVGELDRLDRVAACAASYNVSYTRYFRRVNEYFGLVQSCGTCVRAKNINPCCHGTQCLMMASSAMYASSGFLAVLSRSTRTASI